MEDKARPAVLVVDDTETNIDILVDTLGEEFDVAVAMDGPTALEMAREDPPDLVLLDIMMPGMDGYEVCGELKADPRTQDVPVIFITAKAEVEDETRGFELGASDFIHKPFSPPIVLSRVRSAVSLRQKTEMLAGLTSKLSKYLSPQVYESIFTGDRDVRIGAERKKLTVFFSDIVGFTETTERLEPEDMTELLNSYLEAMSEIAIRHGGTIDKFIGDAILIFFGDPVTQGTEEDALACVHMALDMQKALKALQKQWFAKGIETPFRVRAGINTGFCTVGNFGSKSRMDYTIIGGQVNIAARLEQHARPDQVFISHETWSLVKEEVHCIPRKPVLVKGIAHPVQSYEVVGLKEDMAEGAAAIRVGHLADPAATLPSDALVREAKALLDREPDLDAVVALEGDGPVGLLTRAGLGRLLASETDKAQYFDRPLSEAVDRAFLVVESNSLLEVVAREAAARDRAARYDPVVVTEAGNLKGVLSVSALLESMADIFAAEAGKGYAP